jgi:hypothetical protein
MLNIVGAAYLLRPYTNRQHALVQRGTPCLYNKKHVTCQSRACHPPISKHACSPPLSSGRGGPSPLPVILPEAVLPSDLVTRVRVLPEQQLNT